MMLLHPHRVLGPGELIGALWDAEPPATARGQLQTCVSRLRRMLPSGVIRTEPAGYWFGPAAGEVDAEVFAGLLAEARERRDPALYRQARDLWRGPALSEIDSLAVRRAAAVLDERLMAATEEWVDLELAAGHEPDLLSELTGLVEQFPMRERLRAQLMTGLARSGRPADALAEFRRARATCRSELGIEPGRELQELHQKILAGEFLAPPSPAAASSVVRCLPRTVGDFTGREAVVDRLVGLIDGADPRNPVVAVIDGMAGSGKTTLAVHVASMVGDRYPDAHLFVDLHGHSTEQPVQPATALQILLHQLGVPAERMPQTTVERVALWRTELASRRVLVLLDNAASSTQLADLLPASAGSLALVTSRRRLAGLDGVHPESLGVLGEPEAVALLARIAGDRVSDEPAAAAEVARRCGGLPLALRLAGSRLAHRPRWRVSDLLRRLGGPALPELAAEDRSVADAFSLSFNQLPGPAQRMFRLLGVYPGAVFDGLGVAALTGLSLDGARDSLDELIDVHLVEERAPDSYRMHDLLREFAAALAAELPPAEREQALTGALDLQVHAIVALMPEDVRLAASQDLGHPRPLRADLLSEVTDHAARFEHERAELPAFVEAAAASGRPEYGWWIPRAAWWFMFYRGYTTELTRLLRRAMTIVEKAGNRADVATMANYLASVHGRTGDFRRCRELLELCIRHREELGMRTPLVLALGNMVSVNERTGRYAEAIEAAQRARQLEVLTDGRGVGRSAQMDLGMAYMRLGRYAEALRTERITLQHAVESRDPSRILNSLMNNLRIRLVQGDLPIEVARARYGTLLRLSVRDHVQLSEAEMRSDLAWLLRLEGRYAEALAGHREALALIRRIGDQAYESEILNEYAHTCRAAGDVTGALELYRRAYRLAEPGGIAFEAAVAEAGIAECLVADDPEAARRSWSNALAAFREMGVPERYEIEKRIGELDQLQTAAGGETMGR